MESLNIGYVCMLLAWGACAPESLAAPQAATQAAAAGTPLMTWATPVDSGANLFQVTPTLYRSEQLNAADADLLVKHNIKTIVNLRYFDRNDNQENLSHLPVTLVNQPLKSWRITPADIAEALYQIELAERRGKVLVHCYHGADRTGLIIGMHRIVVENWSIDEAKREMMQGPYGFHSIWRNIPKLYNEQTVAEVRRLLAQKRAAAKSVL